MTSDRGRASAIWIVVVAAVVGLTAAGNTSPLIEAIKSGNVASVRALIKQHVDVNAALPDGTTALHWAVDANASEMAQLLIAAGAKANAANRYGVTPLTLAATNGNAALVEALLKAGAKPNVTVGEGETILMTAARTGNVATIKALVAHDADVNAAEQWQGETALMYAAIENHADAVKLLVELGANVNARSKKLEFPDFVFKTAGMIYAVQPVGSWTPLMYAARDGSIDAARALAASGADLNLVDPDGTTALTLAIINGHFDTAVALLEKGANPNVADKNGMTPLYAAVDMNTIQTVWGRPMPLLEDALDPAGMVRSLLGHGADPNVPLKRPIIGRHTRNTGDPSLSLGTTALARAAKSGDARLMKLLLDGGANPNLTQADLTTAAMIAATGGGQRVYPGSASVSVPATEADSLAAIKLLVEAGVDLDAFNVNGETAIHRAAARGADSIVAYLAEHGARLDQKDRRGRTPLDVAMGLGGGGGRGGPPQVRKTTADLLRRLMQERGITVSAQAANNAASPQ
ncbi:MAG TPA: ankyrin repeat domain-containing protein [Vicinamibacterales bacterium]|jgi:ankyrin repeat protein